jgi:hypothetical protein
MLSALIAPTETAPTAIEVKRALLTYDTVYVVDPADRELIPPQSLFPALGLPPVVAWNAGPMRPLGKSPGYDDSFDRLVEELSSALRQDVIQITSTYDKSTEDQTWIGTVPLGGYPLDPHFVLQIYRAIAGDNNFLKAAIEGDDVLLARDDEYINTISISKCHADKGISNVPALPLIEGKLQRPHLRIPLSEIARAWIATVVKMIGYCFVKELIPIYTGDSYHRIINRVTKNATRTIDQVFRDDPLWTYRSLALRVAHEEYLDEEILAKMDIESILRFRTHAWGEQAKLETP